VEACDDSDGQVARRGLFIWIEADYWRMIVRAGLHERMNSPLERRKIRLRGL
jgi:hypothetical protein